MQIILQLFTDILAKNQQVHEMEMALYVAFFPAAGHGPSSIWSTDGGGGQLDRPCALEASLSHPPYLPSAAKNLGSLLQLSSVSCREKPLSCQKKELGRRGIHPLLWFKKIKIRSPQCLLPAGMGLLSYLSSIFPPLTRGKSKHLTLAHKALYDVASAQARQHHTHAPSIMSGFCDCFIVPSCITFLGLP